MSMIIKYEGVETPSLKLPTWSRISKNDNFIQLQVWVYLSQIDTRTLNWSEDIKVYACTKGVAKILTFKVKDFIKIDNGNPKPLRLDRNIKQYDNGVGNC